MVHRVVLRLISVIVFATQLQAQSPDTVFIRQDHEFDDTLIYATDTVVFESGMRKQILIGTTVLPFTHNQLIARSNGLYLNKITKSDCRSEVAEKSSPDKVNALSGTDTTFIVDISISDNCCYEFLCDASLDSSGTLNLIYYGYGTYCFCECCFGLTFHFTKEPGTKIREVMINDNRKTITKVRK